MALPVLCLYYWTMSFEGIHKQIKHTFLDAFNLDCVCFTLLIHETSNCNIDPMQQCITNFVLM